MSIDSSFIIVPGAQKAGTSTLHRLLTQHSQINSLVWENGQRLKESVFFAMEPKYVDDNFSWFQSLLKNGTGTYVDASPQYLMSPQAPNIIKHYLGSDAKIIITIRDPVDRTISSFLHQKSRNPPTDKRHFEKIIESIWNIRDRGLVEAENTVTRRAANEGYIRPKYLEETHLSNRPFKVNLQDPLHQYKYLQYSIYSTHINRWIKNFDVEVVKFEDIIKNTKSTMDDVFGFLGLNRESVNLPHPNPTRVPTRMKRLYGHISKILRKNKVISDILKSEWAKYIKRYIRPGCLTSSSIKSKIDNRVKEKLRTLLRKNKKGKIKN